MFPPFNEADFVNIEHRNQSGLIHILRAIARDIRVYINSPDEYNRDRASRAIARMPYGMWIPEFAAEDVPLFPIMDPTQSYVEGSMVPIHRCLVILQYLSITHGAEHQRMDYLDSRERLPTESFTVTAADVPWLMTPRV